MFLQMSIFHPNVSQRCLQFSETEFLNQVIGLVENNNFRSETTKRTSFHIGYYEISNIFRLSGAMLSNTFE